MFFCFLLNDHPSLREISPLPEGTNTPPWIHNKRIGAYKLLASIGKGGFGEVFLAEKDGVLKAVKVFTPLRSDSKSFDVEYAGMTQARFLSDHPNFVPIEYVGKEPYCIYYCMPIADSLSDTRYLPATLHNFLVLNPTPPERELVKMAQDILSCLIFLHQKKLIHRDVKPENILKFGSTWKLGDPGLLSHRTKKTAGTPGFFIDLKSHRADETDDLYALGKVLYFACTGMSPEQYPLVPEHYDYDRYSRLRQVYREACERNYRTAEDFLRDLPT